MEEFKQEQIVIRQYLLGGLDAETRQRLEERVLADADFKAQVLLVEDELIEDYADDSLPESERQDFARQFLSLPQQRQRVEVERALFKYAARHEPAPELATPISVPDKESQASSADVHPAISTRKWFIPSSRFLRNSAYGFGGVILLSLLFVGWKYIQKQRSQRQQAEIARELALLNSATASTSNDSQLPVSTFQLTLAPDRTTRGGGTPKTQADPPQVVITSGIEVIQFRLALMTTDGQSYSVLLKMDTNGESFPIDDLRPSRVGRETIITLKIPARLLVGGNGRIKLSRRMPDGQPEWLDDYNFQVVRP